MTIFSFFFKCHSRCSDVKYSTGRAVVILVGLHSYQKSFTEMESLYSQIWGQRECNKLCFIFFNIFPEIFFFSSSSKFSVSSINLFQLKLSSLFSWRRSLVIWFNYNCSTSQIFGKHTQINQANTDTLQVDRQKARN